MVKKFNMNDLFPLFCVLLLFPWRFESVSEQQFQRVLTLVPEVFLAGVSSVPVRSERDSGHAKECFAFGPREKWGENKKVEIDITSREAARKIKKKIKKKVKAGKNQEKPL